MSTLSNVGIGGQLSVTNTASFNNTVTVAASGTVQINTPAGTIGLSNTGNTQLGTDLYFASASNYARLAIVSTNYISVGQTYIGLLTVGGQMSTLSNVGIGGQLSVTNTASFNNTVTVAASGSIQINTPAGTIGLSNAGDTQLGTNLFFTTASNYARLAMLSTTLMSSGNITIGNTMNALIASTQQTITSSFFGNLADANTVVVQLV
jgi:hypothetical protein